jgi:hypothetical protein
MVRKLDRKPYFLHRSHALLTLVLSLSSLRLLVGGLPGKPFSLEPTESPASAVAVVVTGVVPVSETGLPVT